VRSGFKPFTLDVSGLHLQQGRSLVGQNLGNREQFTLSPKAEARSAGPRTTSCTR
jgi:type III restriction enzyme